MYWRKVVSAFTSRVCRGKTKYSSLHLVYLVKRRNTHIRPSCTPRVTFYSTEYVFLRLSRFLVDGSSYDLLLPVHEPINQSINISIKTHLYSAICRERIRSADFDAMLWKGGEWPKENPHTLWQRSVPGTGSRMYSSYIESFVFSRWQHHPMTLSSYS